MVFADFAANPDDTYEEQITRFDFWAAQAVGDFEDTVLGDAIALSPIAGTSRDHTFFDNFSQGFLDDFAASNPLEFEIFKEYATNILSPFNPKDPRYFEYHWRGFEPYLMEALENVMAEELGGLGNVSFDPLSNLPGGTGAAIGGILSIEVIRQLGGLANVISGSLAILANGGPQVINKATFEEAFGAAGPALDELFGGESW